MSLHGQKEHMPNRTAQRQSCALCGATDPIGGFVTEPLLQNLETGEPARVCQQWRDRRDRKSKTLYEGCRTRLLRRRAEEGDDDVDSRFV